MRRRAPLLPLDRLVIGASPDKLRKDLTPAVSPREALPLSEKERRRLEELLRRHPIERLTYAELYEMERLRARRHA